MRTTESTTMYEGSPLTRRELHRMRLKLLTERRSASGRLDRALRDARSGEGVVEVGDPADFATGAEEMERLLVAARRERAFIREIDRAIEKLELGEFGLCEGTGEPIERRRLEAWPWTRYSRAYLEILESEAHAA